MTKRHRITLYFVIVLVGIILDQLTKAWAREALVGGSQTFIPGILDLMLVMNTGAAFSIGAGSTWVFIIIAAVLVGAATLWVIREDALPTPLVCTLACVSSGGLGNLIDRVVFGKVTDFFATTFMDFPVFNVADIFVTCGVVLSLIVLFRWDSQSAQAPNAED